MPASDDYVTQAIQALAALYQANVTGLGYVFDTDDSNPSPDVVSPALVGLYANAGPVLTFGGTERFQLDVAPSTKGRSSRHFDTYLVPVTLTFGYWDSYRTSYAARARVFAYRLRKVTLEHNRLGNATSVIFLAEVQDGTAGWVSDPDGARRYDLVAPLALTHEYTMSPGT